MNKLTSIRIKQEDGTYSEEYPVSVLAENVVWEQGQLNSLVDILGQVSFDTNGSIQHQIDVLDNKKFNTSDLNTYLAGQISTDVASWLNTNVNPVGSAVTVDESLTISGSAADSKVVGDNITDLKNTLNEISTPYGVNLFNPDALIENTFLNATTGLPEANNNYWATDFIPIDGTYTARPFEYSGVSRIRLYLYNSDKTYNKRYVQSAESYQQGYSFTWSGYLRINIDNGNNNAYENPNKYMLVMGSAINEFVPYYTAFDKKARENALRNLNKITKIRDVYGENLFDYETISHSVFLNSTTGAEEGNPTYNASDYITVTAGSTYTIRTFVYSGIPSYRIYFYKADKTYIQRYTDRIENNPTGYVFTTPSDCTYIRLNFETGTNANGTQDETTTVFVRGSTTISEYIPYYTAYDRTARNGVYSPQISWINGSAYDYRNGNLFTESYTETSCYARIPVDGNKRLELYTKGYGISDNRGLAFFDKSNKYISGVQYAIAAAGTGWIKTDIPQNAESVGISAYIDFVENGSFIFQFVQSNDAIHESFGKVSSGVINPIHTTPIYIGDFLIGGDEQHGCACRIDNKIYSFVCNNSSENTSNNGTAYIFDLDNNALYRKTTLALGHANSCAYDFVNGILYIVPVYDYENGGTAAYYLYKYDKYLRYIGKEDLSFNPTGVSYDPVTRTLWSSKYSNGYVYRKKSDGTWEHVFTIPFDDYEINAPGGQYDQGIAVFNNNFFVPSSRRSMLYGRIVDNGCIVTGGLAWDAVDSLYVHRLGELEDCEFTQDGHMIAADYTQITENCKNAFVLELPVGFAVPQIPNVGGGPWEMFRKLTLSATTQAKFCLSRNEIRTLAQMYSTLQSSRTVKISGSVNDYNRIEFNNDVTLELDNATLNTTFLFIRSGKLTINNTTAGSVINFSASSGFRLNAGGDLAIRGNSDLTISTSGGVDVLSDIGITELQFVPAEASGNFTINNMTVTNAGMYRGSDQFVQF